MTNCFRDSISSMMDATSDAALMVDPDGKLLHMNSSAEGLYEFSLQGNGDATSHPDILSLVTLDNPSGDGNPTDWSQVVGILQNKDKAPKKWTAACTKRSGDVFDSEICMALMVSEDSSKTMVVMFLKPVEHDSSRFDHMTRYMSTLLNMLTSIIESSLDPIFQINEEGVIQMVNKAAETQFGYNRDEFIGANISMICGGPHGPRHGEYLKRYIQTGETRVMGKKRELPARRKDGREFPVELGLVEIMNESTFERMFVGFVRDLSDVKKKERLTMGLVQACFDPMFQVDENGAITFVNDAMKEFGYAKEEFIDKSIHDLIITGDGGSFLQRYMNSGKEAGVKQQMQARRKDGSEFPVELGLSEVETEKGENRIFCGFVRKLG